jgi:hypothetical protein
MIQIINNYAIEIILLTLTAGLVLAEIVIAYAFYSIYKMFKNGNEKTIKKNVIKSIAFKSLKNEMLKDKKNNIEILNYYKNDAYETKDFTCWIEEA